MFFIQGNLDITLIGNKMRETRLDGLLMYKGGCGCNIDKSLLLEVKAHFEGKKET